MRKFVFLMTLIVGIVAFNVVFAASSNHKVAVVVISEDNDFKSQRFTDMVKEIFEKDNKNITILSGSESQNKYINYWAEKNLDTLEEPMPTKTDLINFVSYGNYDKVIYLIVKNTDVTITGRGGPYGGTSRKVSVTVNSTFRE